MTTAPVVQGPVIPPGRSYCKNKIIKITFASWLRMNNNTRTFFHVDGVIFLKTVNIRRVTQSGSICRLKCILLYALNTSAHRRHYNISWLIKCLNQTLMGSSDPTDRAGQF